MPSLEWTPTLLARNLSFVREAFEKRSTPVPVLVVDDPLPTSENTLGVGALYTAVDHRQAASSTSFDNGFVSNLQTQEDWFENFYVLPRSVDGGNILTTQLINFEVYSAFRRTIQNWLSFTNNAGTGTTMLNLPTFPHPFGPQSSDGLSLQLQILTTGVSSVNTTLDFAFDSPSTIEVQITLERVVLWNMDPETPYQETLEFLTDIIRHKDGSEQRISSRKRPRQFFEWEFILDDGLERARLDNILFDWQQRLFGIPQWHERTSLTIAATALDTSVTVNGTAFADYRITGSNLVVIYQDQNTFDVVPLLSLTATTLSFDAPLQNSYPVGTVVAPLRVGFAERLVRGARFPKNAAQLRMRFRVDDNDNDIASTAAFSTFNSKVLLDGLNGMGQRMTEIYERQIFISDGEVGLTEQKSPWTRNRRNSFKTFLTAGKQPLWETRQLLHSLRGKQVSFYLPTFADDLQVDLNITSGSALLTIVNVGYTKFVGSKQPRNVIRIEFNNGDATILRIVLSSTESATQEVLTLDTTFPNNVTIAQVERISYVEKVRFDSDVMTFVYQSGGRVTKIQAPVKTVFE